MAVSNNISSRIKLRPLKEVSLNKRANLQMLSRMWLTRFQSRAVQASTRTLVVCLTKVLVIIHRLEDSRRLLPLLVPQITPGALSGARTLIQMDLALVRQRTRQTPWEHKIRHRLEPLATLLPRKEAYSEINKATLKVHPFLVRKRPPNPKHQLACSAASSLRHNRHLVEAIQLSSRKGVCSAQSRNNLPLVNNQPLATCLTNLHKRHQQVCLISRVRFSEHNKPNQEWTLFRCRSLKAVCSVHLPPHHKGRCSETLLLQHLACSDRRLSQRRVGKHRSSRL